MFRQPRNALHTLSEKNVYLARASMVQSSHGTLKNFLPMIVNQLTTLVQKTKKTKTLKPKGTSKRLNIFPTLLRRLLGLSVTQSSACQTYQISINLLQGIMGLKSDYGTLERTKLINLIQLLLITLQILLLMHQKEKIKTRRTLRNKRKKEKFYKSISKTKIYNLKSQMIIRRHHARSWQDTTEQSENLLTVRGIRSLSALVLTLMSTYGTLTLRTTSSNLMAMKILQSV